MNADELVRALADYKQEEDTPDELLYFISFARDLLKPDPEVILMWVTEEEPTDPINPPYVPGEEVEPYVIAVCPHCGVVDQITERDVGERWNEAEISLEGSDIVVHHSLGDGDFEGDGYFCQSCLKDVDLPLDDATWS